MDDSAERTRVEWREWAQDAFDVAERTGKPVLLSVTATWCRHCHEMDVETYAEPRIAANVNDGFVPVRVDADRHPRVRERYTMGGFPSTVFLTPDGEVLTGAGYLGPDGMRQALDSVREMWDAKGTVAGRVPRALQDDPTPAAEVTDRVESLLLGQLDATYDHANGGWGTAEKFPMPRTVEFALKRERAQALRTLDAIATHLQDEDGGVFRFAESPDWSNPHREKVLDVNAALVRAFANAYCYTGDETYRDPAAATIDYLVDTLWNGRAFGGSQAGTDPEYYAADPAEREDHPRVDLTAFADWNALAVDALLTYHAYTDDERAREYAEQALRTVRSELVTDDRVVHYRDGDETGESGLLADHARMVAALARARQVLGPDALDGDDPTGLAARLADHVLDTLQDDAGALRDGPADGPGLLSRPLRPLDATVEFADALLDLAVLSGTDRYREAARDAIAAYAGASDRLGPRVASYASVAARLQRPGLVVDVGAPAGSDLHRAALRVADHEKVVVPDASDVPDEEARVTVGETAEMATTPAELDAVVRDLVR